MYIMLSATAHIREALTFIPFTAPSKAAINWGTYGSLTWYTAYSSCAQCEEGESQLAQGFHLALTTTPTWVTTHLVVLKDSMFIFSLGNTVSLQKRLSPSCIVLACVVVVIVVCVCVCV